jgi:hypothetical protein
VQDQGIKWPELRFPPVNLWAIAAMSQMIEQARSHRKQRPVFSVAQSTGEKMALHQFRTSRGRRDIRMQMQRLLASRQEG